MVWNNLHPHPLLPLPSLPFSLVSLCICFSQLVSIPLLDCQTFGLPWFGLGHGSDSSLPPHTVRADAPRWHWMVRWSSTHSILTMQLNGQLDTRPLVLAMGWSQSSTRCHLGLVACVEEHAIPFWEEYYYTPMELGLLQFRGALSVDPLTLAWYPGPGRALPSDSD